MSYGKKIPNLVIDNEPAPYSVVNEREIRAAAGIMFVIGLSAFWYIFLTKDYTPLYYIVPLFWLDFFFKSVFSPELSIFGFIARLIVRKQKPEYVGAIQKRFAWGLGLAMATAMIVVAIILQLKGPAPFAICMTCLFFMWLESVFGICVGCNIYGFLINKNLIKAPEYRPACPGGACSLNKTN